MDFAGKVAFITGATRGVGKCIALALADRGCSIVVAAKTTKDSRILPGTIDSVAAEIQARGAKALPLRVDVRDDENVASAVKQALDTFGRIDFLVNNAGALHWQSMTESPLRKYDLVNGVNARGAYACTYHVLPAMIEQGYGHILMMSPPVVPQASAGKIAYAISKFGMTLIAHGLAGEVQDKNVACNALWPATMIESYATINWKLGTPKLWRKADILADAAVAVFSKTPAEFTGHALIDEDFLRQEGVSDFAKYRCDPEHEPPRVDFDFKIKAGRA